MFIKMLFAMLCLLSVRADAPYLPAPIGAEVEKYLPVPASGMGPAIDRDKGYRVEELGTGLYMITDNVNQSMFMVYDKGVVVIDAPQSYAKHIPEAIREITDKSVTHLIYSHSHADHIGGADVFKDSHPIIIAHKETKAALITAADPHRPLPTLTFSQQYTLRVGEQQLQLSYHGVAHTPGNIFIYAPAQKTLMVVDIVFPGWMPWRRLALAKDIPGYFRQVEEIRKLPWDKFVGGHVSRIGTHADVDLQSEFMADLRNAAAAALKENKAGEGVNPADLGNGWAVYGHFIDRVAHQCVATLTPKWSTKLAGYDVFVWDQCYAMEQSLRID
ncbi:MAG: MBL fold metallo-hydrolase [Bdellovibrionota bacterium]